jgi:protein-S-isoprenylcysteine O-methyltransferase Ste14
MTVQGKINNALLRKLLFLPVFFLYVDSGIIVFFTEYLRQPLVIINLLLMNGALGADILVRKQSAQEDRFNPLMMIVTFMCLPLLTLAPPLERLIGEAIGLPGESIVVYVCALALEALGAFFLIAGRLRLGKWGTQSIVLEDDHRLVTDGVYRFVRNPIYLGMILIPAGFILSFSAPVGAILLAAGLVTMFSIRIRVEEELLAGRFGEEYRDYCRRTKRLVPFLF